MEPTATRLPRSAAAVVDRAVLDALAGSAGRSRADLELHTGLSRAAVAAATDRLVADGRVTVSGTVASADRGRPARRYQLAQVATPVALVSLARDTRTLLTVVDADGRPVAASDAGDWTQATWEAWSAAVDARLTELELDRTAGEVVLMVASPWHDEIGPPRPRAVPEALRAQVRSKGGHDLPAWLDAAVADRLGEFVGARVRVANDANLAGLGELVHGAGRGSRLGLHVSVREGIGACVVVDGRVVVGATGMAGELAHVQVDVDGALCACGNRGCLATTTSTITTAAAVSALHGVPLTAADVDTLVDHADPLVLRYFGDLGRTLGTVVAGSVTLLNPDVLVVDGTLGPAVEAVVGGLREELVRRCPPAVVQAVRVVGGALANPHAAGARALVRGR